MQRDWYAKIVRERFPLSADVNRLISAATFDLWHGPQRAGEVIDDQWVYPGFSEAVDLIRKALDVVCELWIDRDSDCTADSEPQSEEIDGQWCEPAGDWWHLERRDVLRVLLGKELATYV